MGVEVQEGVECSQSQDMHRTEGLCYVQVSIVRHKSHAQSMMSITRHDPAPDTVNQ